MHKGKLNVGTNNGKRFSMVWKGLTTLLQYEIMIFSGTPWFITELRERCFNSLVKIFKFQLGFAFFPKEMHQKCCLCLLNHLLSEGENSELIMTTHRFKYPPQMQYVIYSQINGAALITALIQTKYWVIKSVSTARMSCFVTWKRIIGTPGKH